MVKGGHVLAGILLTGLLFMAGFTCCYGQEDYNSQYYYRFYLKDKGGITPGMVDAAELFSPRAIDRRTKNGINIDLLDMPVYTPYSDSIVNLGLKISCKSKWMNTITASSPAPLNTQELAKTTYIDSVVMVKSPLPLKGSSFYNKEPEQDYTMDAPPYLWQLEMHGADLLQELGFDGSGVVIAVIDGGFSNANEIESVSDAFAEDRILGTWDFVKGTPDVYDYSQHGTAVLSIIAGNWPGYISGSAPGASYWLIRSEEVISEYQVEEDFWVAAAEFADSAGVDIISTSLGYSLFTDESMNHTYNQMDGESVFISMAAGIAFSRGIVVVTSAGNSRDDPWYYITAPADAMNVLAAGAVDQESVISNFSSSGPSFDNRVKPDVATMGVAVTIQTVAGSVKRGNGTSYSCPLLAGMVACLQQAFPGATHAEITEAVKISADRYLHPDDLYGYGIVNIYHAYQYLLEKAESGKNIMHLYPNPTSSYLYVRFNSSQEDVKIMVFDLAGRKVIDRDYINVNQPMIEIPGFQYLPGGTYIVRIESGPEKWTEKIIKIRE